MRGLSAKSSCRELVLRLYLFAYTVLLVAMELLSLFHCINRFTVGILSCLEILFFVWALKEYDLKVGMISRRLRLLLRCRWLYWIVAIGICALLSGLLYPPLNYDSNSYHLPRVVQWIHQGSLQYYKTDIVRQLYQMPLAEMAIMQLQLLTGGDLFAFLPQFVAWCICIMASTMICQTLGGCFRSQILCAVLTATINMGILQCSSTQNDLVVASFFLAFLYYLLRFRDRRPSVCLALSMGLALATKGTAYVYIAVPGILLGGMALWKSEKPKRDFLLLSSVVFLALLMNAGIYFRSIRATGKPLSGGGTSYFVETCSPRLMALNSLKHHLHHCLLPDHSYVICRFAGNISAIKRFASFETIINAGIIEWICRALPRINAEEITWNDCDLHGITSDIHEDRCGEPLHFLVIVIALGILALRLKKGSCDKNKSLRAYAIACCFNWFLFTALLKWNYWQPRLHLPLFISFMPMTAILLEGHCPCLWRKIVTVLMIISGCYCVVFGQPRVLSSKIRQIISGSALNRTENYLNYDNVSALVAHIPSGVKTDDIGICCYEDAPVYPIFVLLGIHASAGKALGYDHDKPLLISTFDHLEGYKLLHDGTPFKLWMRDAASVTP